MKKEKVNKEEKEIYEAPMLEVVNVKLERNFASGGGSSSGSDRTGRAIFGIEGFNNSEWSS